MAVPGYLDQSGAAWRRIELCGERPAWREWETQTGRSAPPGHVLRVDSMEQALMQGKVNALAVRDLPADQNLTYGLLVRAVRHHQPQLAIIDEDSRPNL